MSWMCLLLRCQFLGFVMENVHVYIHDKILPCEHSMWDGLPKSFITVSSMCQLINKLSEYTVCVGNYDDDLMALNSVGRPVQDTIHHEYLAASGSTYLSTIRHKECMLLSCSVRCSCCQKVRSCLRSKRARRLSQEGYTNPSKANTHLTLLEKDVKLKKLAKQQKALKRKVDRLHEKVKVLQQKAKTLIEAEGESLSSSDSQDVASMLQENEAELSSLPEDWFQKILFEQQLKYNSLKNKANMRWHPAVIRWCLYVRSKSSKAYDGMRSCLPLPSQRTLWLFKLHRV